MKSAPFDYELAFPHASSMAKLRMLVLRRNVARFEGLRRSIGMQIAHERRRLVESGLSLSEVEAFDRFLDRRPRCRFCGRFNPLS